MEKYFIKNKLLKIDSIDLQKMVLDDSSEWEFMGASRPPSTWKAGDEVVIKKPEENSPYQSMYGVTNNIRKGQPIPVVYLGGSISEEDIVRINKSLKGYPEERLGWDLRIKDLLEDSSILLEDWSVWQLTGLANKDMGEWNIGQIVHISKGSSGLDLYRIENLSINKPPFIAKFLGFRE